MTLPSVLFDLLDDWGTLKFFLLLFKLSGKIVSLFPSRFLLMVFF